MSQPSVQEKASGLAAPVDFYFEFASPYSYLASLQIESVARAAGRTVEWRPIEIGRIWKRLGILDQFLAIRAVKVSYILKDALRCAERAGVAMVRPASPAIDTTLAKLAYWGLRESDPVIATLFLRQVWQRYFGNGLAIITADDLAQAVTALGLTGDDIATAAAHPSARAAQDAANRDAVDAGCFGVPWLVADGESFFGHDRLDHLSDHLRGRHGNSI